VDCRAGGAAARAAGWHAGRNNCWRSLMLFLQCLDNIRQILRERREAAGLVNGDDFACCWHIPMEGSIIAAAEGDVEAARRAQAMGLCSHRTTSTASRRLNAARAGLTCDICEYSWGDHA
jgi:hypothetical protein